MMLGFEFLIFIGLVVWLIFQTKRMHQIHENLVKHVSVIDTVLETSRKQSDRLNEQYNLISALRLKASLLNDLIDEQNSDINKLNERLDVVMFSLERALQQIKQEIDENCQNLENELQTLMRAHGELDPELAEVIYRIGRNDGARVCIDILKGGHENGRLQRGSNQETNCGGHRGEITGNMERI